MNNKNSNWWQIIFNTTEYFEAFSSIYSSSRTKQEVDFILQTLNIDVKDKILDIPCGYGRHSIDLAQRGFNVTGVDFSKSLIKIALNKARIKKISSIRFICGDMRYFNAGQQYDIILNLGNSFGYFKDKDNERVIKAFSKHLRKGGKLILDLPNTVGMLRRKDIKSKTKIPGGYLFTKETSFDPLNLRVKIMWKFVTSKKKIERKGEIRLYTLPEIRTICEKQKLKIIKVLGSFNNTKYTIDSPRMITVAEKI